MQRTDSLTLSLLLSCLLLITLCNADSVCSKNSSLVGFESDFMMVQHQLRGHLSILDDCSFRVSLFDMLPGYDVHWWGAIGDDFDNLTNGFVVSDHGLNDTFKNASFDVRLKNDVDWSRIHVLSVWDTTTLSNFGHVLLVNESDLSDLSPSLAPSPSANDSSGVDERRLGFRVPTMFDNCKVLSKDYRVRWRLSEDKKFVDLGLEAATGIQNYMAFGWAKDGSGGSNLMVGADVAVCGFTDEGFPFVDDFYITDVSECILNSDGSAKGVCPDSAYEGSEFVGFAPDNVRLVKNLKLIYGHRKDGVSFVRFRRPLVSDDKKYDLPVNYSESLTVIWATGLLKLPDSIQPFYLPQNHGGENFGHLVLKLSENVNDCLGPLDANDKEDQELIIADAKVPLVVTTGNASHYPNPPNPSKVLYINKKEAPVLRVERGVPVKFSVQAGHGIAFYITSDMVGGNATLRNTNEKIYAGGPEVAGVAASPAELVWEPDRNTPDQLYYGSLYDQKMGWRIQVVDGGLSDMYNNSVLLDDQQVTFFWTLAEDSISIAARGEKKSGYVAIGFGSEMLNSFAYVGWVDDNGKGHVNSYWISAKDASGVHPTNENLTYVRCKSENGIITFEFTRPLKPSNCTHSNRPECKNLIDPSTPLKVIWAMGSKWSDDDLTDKNMHSATSVRSVHVLLMRGSAEAEQDLRPVLAVHGFMMFLAWGILLPGGILAARYLKHVKGDGWYQIHVYLQYSGLVIILLGLLFAVAELGGLYVSSLHVKFGLAAIFLGCAQPLNASMRPKKPANGEEFSSKRLLWEYLHAIVGRCAVIVGIAALFTGMKHLEDRYGSVHGYNWALILWFSVGAIIIVYLEVRERQRNKERSVGRGNWVLGNPDEDDSTDLLSPGRDSSWKHSEQSAIMEVQLEPLNR